MGHPAPSVHFRVKRYLVIVNVWAPEVPPDAALSTVTVAVPAVLRSDAGTTAVSLLVLSKVIGNTDTLPPLGVHLTVEVPDTKFEPLTVRVRSVAAPAFVVFGSSESILGAALALPESLEVFEQPEDEKVHHI